MKYYKQREERAPSSDKQNIIYLTYQSTHEAAITAEFMGHMHRFDHVQVDGLPRLRNGKHCICHGFRHFIRELFRERDERVTDRQGHTMKTRPVHTSSASFVRKEVRAMEVRSSRSSRMSGFFTLKLSKNSSTRSRARSYPSAMTRGCRP